MDIAAISPNIINPDGSKAHDAVISQAKIDDGLSDHELVTIHKLYQIQLYINWQTSRFGAQCLRPDEWLTYACDFFHPVFCLIHAQSAAFKAQISSLCLKAPLFQSFPHFWTKIVDTDDFSIDKDAANHLSDTIAATVFEIAMLFPEMKAYERSCLLDPVQGGRERIAGYLSRSINTQNLSGEPDVAGTEGRDRPMSVEYWLSNIISTPHDTPDEQDNSNHTVSFNFFCAEPESHWAKRDFDKTSANPLAIAFDPEHKNTTLQDSVLDHDGVEYFTSAMAFCARLRLLECSEILDLSNPEFGDIFQSMLRGSALWWFINELADKERDYLRTTSLVTLTRAMMWRFPVLSQGQATRLLEDPNGYLAVLTAEGCSDCVDLLRIQMLQLCRLAQVAELADQPRTYVEIWERLEPKLQKFFDRPESRTGDHDGFVALIDRGLRKALLGERALVASENKVGEMTNPNGSGGYCPDIKPEEPQAKKEAANGDEAGGGGPSYCMCTSCCEKHARQGIDGIISDWEDDEMGFRMRTWPFLGRALVD